MNHCWRFGVIEQVTEKESMMVTMEKMSVEGGLFVASDGVEVSIMLQWPHGRDGLSAEKV